MFFQIIERMLTIPAKYWGQFAYPDNAGTAYAQCTSTPDRNGKSLVTSMKKSPKMTNMIKLQTLTLVV